MPRHGEQGERLAKLAGVGAQWMNSQNEVKAEFTMQLKTAFYGICIWRQIYIAQKILFMSLSNSKTYPLLEFSVLLLNEESE